MGQNIFYVGHDFSVGYVDQIYFCVSLCAGQNTLGGYQKYIYIFLRGSAFIYEMKLIYYTTTNSLNIFFVSLFPANVDQTLFDLFNNFEWLIRNL